MIITHSTLLTGTQVKNITPLGPLEKYAFCETHGVDGEVMTADLVSEGTPCRYAGRISDPLHPKSFIEFYIVPDTTAIRHTKYSIDLVDYNFEGFVHPTTAEYYSRQIKWVQTEEGRAFLLTPEGVAIRKTMSAYWGTANG